MKGIGFGVGAQARTQARTQAQAEAQAQAKARKTTETTETKGRGKTSPRVYQPLEPLPCDTWQRVEQCREIRRIQRMAEDEGI